MPRIIIPPQFNGPPGSGNGGYVAGRIAAFASGPVEVTLRAPIPVGTPLEVVAGFGGQLVLQGRPGVVATARPVPFEGVEPARLPSLAEAEAAAARMLEIGVHPFPACFVCGPSREPGDGMRLFAGPIDDVRGLHAAAWTPSEAVAAAGGNVLPEFTWAALDCPGGFAAVQGEWQPILLGRMAASLERPVRAGVPHIVTAWVDAVEGRKRHVGTAIHTLAGERCASARATWIIPAAAADRAAA